MRTSVLLGVPVLMFCLATGVRAADIYWPKLGTRIFKPDVHFPNAGALGVDYLAASSRSVVGVRLEHNGNKRLLCRADFIRGHEVIKRRFTTLVPGMSRTLSAPIRRNLHRFDINVNCQES